MEQRVAFLNYANIISRLHHNPDRLIHMIKLKKSLYLSICQRYAYLRQNSGFYSQKHTREVTCLGGNLVGSVVYRDQN